MSAMKYLGLLGGLGGGLATGAIGHGGINPAWLGISPLGSMTGLFGDRMQEHNPLQFMLKMQKRGGMFGAGMPGGFGMMGGDFYGG